MEGLEQRMYCLVLRHLSGINKGIQCTHACEQYGEKYHNTPEYRKYIKEDKTLIVLDGGSAVDMQSIQNQLSINCINYYAFEEPDLLNLTTAICFLADERVWDRITYLNYEGFKNETFGMVDESTTMQDLANAQNAWFEYIGGKENAIKMELISGKRLAI